MKNLSIITVLIGLSLYSCRENPNMVPQTTTSSAPLTAIYTQHMGKQWLLGSSSFSYNTKSKLGGPPYDTFYNPYKESTYIISVISDSIVSFMGMEYHYVDTPIYSKGKIIPPDTNERLLFYYDYGGLAVLFSHINYYYKRDSFECYYFAGDGYNGSQSLYYSK